MAVRNVVGKMLFKWTVEKNICGHSCHWRDVHLSGSDANTCDSLRNSNKRATPGLGDRFSLGTLLRPTVLVSQPFETRGSAAPAFSPRCPSRLLCVWQANVRTHTSKHLTTNQPAGQVPGPGSSIFSQDFQQVNRLSCHHLP